MLDLKNKPDDIVFVEKIGCDDYGAVICNPQMLLDKGVKIPPLTKYLNNS